MSRTRHSAASSSDLLLLTAQIVAAHVASNSITADALPDLIGKVHSALASAGGAPMPELPPQQQPAIPVKRSIQPDYLICLEDGARVTMLKRYLRHRFGLEPNQYRAKWGLAPDYPMVAPNHSSKRSATAKQVWLVRKGTFKRKPGRPAEEPEAVEGIAITKLRARRARGANG